jgi:deoxyribodipyrimidine photo-lyase
VVWFRRDLRLDDNPAWADAVAGGGEVVALFVVDPVLFDRAAPLRRAQLVAELAALDDDLRHRTGGRLHVRHGDPRHVVPAVAAEAGAGAVVAWNADVGPYATRRDRAVAAGLELPPRTWYGSLVHRPGAVLTGKGTLSRVFTAFHRVWLRTPWDPWPDGPAAGATEGPRVAGDPGQGLPEAGANPPQRAGAAAALARLDAFLPHLDRYPDDRDRPDLDATSGLSVDLKLGTLSPRAVVRAVEGAPGAEPFVRQLAWRDWYAHLLAERPDLPTTAMQARFDAIAWRDDPDAVQAWREGRTGVPIVDAGMRQLAATGRLHGRVRMLCASFLVKNLLVDWRVGERHLRHLLLDGDLAQNVGNWQWVAGTGPDAAPYDRIFNPVLQARRHDPDGTYVRTWVPELAELAAPGVHAPWELGPLELAAAGVVLGDTYPAPLVDLGESRARALAAYRAAPKLPG